MEQFLWRKTRTFSSEETGGLDQPDGCQEGPFVNRQGVQAEEPGGGLGEGKCESGQWRRGWAESDALRDAARLAVGAAAARAERGHLSASARAAAPHPESGQAW